jgi:hypothetical protein
MSEKLDSSKANGIHFQLNRLTGEWQGTATVWFEPDVIADQSPVHATMRPLLDGRFILMEYQGSFAGKPLDGLAILGFHLETEKYQTAWVDSFHTGTAMIFSESSRHAKQFNVLGSYEYVSPEVDQKWGWRTEVEMTNDDELKMTAYNIESDGSEAKATETIFKRVK